METIRGSIADIEEGIIIHRVNCRNRIGCGLAGGNWDKISAWFADVPNLYVVKP